MNPDTPPQYVGARKSRWEIFLAALFLNGIGLLAAYFQGRSDGEQNQIERMAEASARNGNGVPCAECPDEMAAPSDEAPPAASPEDHLGTAPTSPTSDTPEDDRE